MKTAEVRELLAALTLIARALERISIKLDQVVAETKSPYVRTRDTTGTRQ